MERLSKIKIEDFKIKVDLKFDLFICSSSFEERCLSIASHIDKESVDKVRICNFENNYEIADANKDKLFNEFPNHDTEILPLKKHDPIFNFIQFTELVESLKSGAIIAVDITTFTREVLLILLRILFLKHLNVIAYFYYTPSSKYSSGLDPKDCWISKGVKEIRSVFGYPGDFSSLKEFLLIVLTGIEYERAQILIDNYEPSKILLGKALPINSVNSELAELNNYNLDKLKNRYLFAEEFEFSCIDLQETKQKISTLIEQNKEQFNIIIAPMNNKLSTIAVGIVALENPSIQICYASTNQYNINGYSSAMDFVYEINFENYLLNHNI